MEQLRRLLQSTTNRLVAINIAAFIMLQAVFAGAPSGLELYFFRNPEFHLWQLVSYMFLHGSWPHLAFNMLALWSFGRMLERVWGGQRFLFFYFVCGVGAALVHLVEANFVFQGLVEQIIAAGFSELDIREVLDRGRYISGNSALISREMQAELYTIYHVAAVGASGAVYGLLVAFALLFPNFKVILIFLPVPIAAKYFVPVLLLIDLSAGVTGISIFGSAVSIAHFAHIGGALFGFLMVQFWLRAAR